MKDLYESCLSRGCPCSSIHACEKYLCLGIFYWNRNIERDEKYSVVVCSMLKQSFFFLGLTLSQKLRGLPDSDGDDNSMFHIPNT